MSARHKLNALYFGGAFLVAGFVGLATDSAIVFVMMLGAMLLVAVKGGDIRLR